MTCPRCGGTRVGVEYAAVLNVSDVFETRGCADCLHEWPSYSTTVAQHQHSYDAEITKIGDLHREFMCQCGARETILGPMGEVAIKLSGSFNLMADAADLASEALQGMATALQSVPPIQAPWLYQSTSTGQSFATPRPARPAPPAKPTPEPTTHRRMIDLEEGD
jgi:hypothetical protein